MTSGWWVADLLHSDGGAWALVSWAFWVILSITLHELGHGVAAIRVGDDTPIRLNRMTLNPLVHMGPTSLIVFAVVGIAWGAMPVNPYRFRGKHADALVAAAGPAVNIGLLIVCVLTASAITKYAIGDRVADAMAEHYAASSADLAERYDELGEQELVAHFMELAKKEAEITESVVPVASRFHSFFFTGAMLNAVLLVLNLLPIPPLDGSRILASFSGAYRRLAEGPHATGIALVAILVIFMSGGGVIWEVGSWLTWQVSDLTAGLLP